jgi:hypothetical protein
LVDEFRNVVAIVETRIAASAMYEVELYRTGKFRVRALGHCPIDSPRTVPGTHLLLFPISTWLKIELNVKNRTETLEIGSRAPDFSLGAANREGTFTLAGLLAQGTLILEFLRGTW